MQQLTLSQPNLDFFPPQLAVVADLVSHTALGAGNIIEDNSGKWS